MSDTLVRPSHVPERLVVDFDIFNPSGVEQGFHRALKAVQTDSPHDIVWTPRNGGHWIALRGKLINRIYADYKRFSSRNRMVPKSEFGAIDMLPTDLDPPTNIPYRKILSAPLSPKAVAAIEPKMRQLAIDLIEGFQKNGGCDFTYEYAEKFPIYIFMALLDLPLADAPKLKGLADRITRPQDALSVVSDYKAIADYLEPVIDARTGKDGEDLLSVLINGRLETRLVSKAEAMTMCSQILLGGLDTVANELSFFMHFLAENPYHRQQLIADRSLIPQAVNELLRRLPIVSMAREVTHDMDYEGVFMKCGDMILIPTPLHGLDDRENVQAMEVDFGRENLAHSTFGEGGHKCPGAHLARTELRITIEEWLPRIPEFQIVPGTKLAFGSGVVGYIQSLPLSWKK